MISFLVLAFEIFFIYFFRFFVNRGAFNWWWPTPLLCLKLRCRNTNSFILQIFQNLLVLFKFNFFIWLLIALQITAFYGFIDMVIMRFQWVLCLCDLGTFVSNLYRLCDLKNLFLCSPVSCFVEIELLCSPVDNSGLQKTYYCL